MEDALHAARTPDDSGRAGVIGKNPKGQNLVSAAKALKDTITTVMKTIDTRVDELITEAEREFDHEDARAGGKGAPRCEIEINRWEATCCVCTGVLRT